MRETSPLNSGPQSQDLEDQDPGPDVVVIGRRDSRPSPEPRLVIEVNSGGANSPSERWVELFRALITESTDVDIGPSFTAGQKAIIIKALQGLADHPVYGPAVRLLEAKGWDVNIRWDFRGTEVPAGKNGAVRGFNPDGTADRGESLTIWIKPTRGGEPISDRFLAEIIVHEFMHLLNDIPGLDAAIDNTDIDADVYRAIFSGYDFASTAPAGETVTPLQSSSQPGETLYGVAGMKVLVASDVADTIVTGIGGSLTYSGAGDDRIVAGIDGLIDQIIDSSGSDTIVLNGAFTAASVTARWTNDGRDVAILVDGVQEVTVSDAATSGAVETLEVNGTSYSLGTFITATNTAPIAENRHIEIRGGFVGGNVGNVAAADPDGDAVTYRLVSIGGDFADENWTIDPQTGWIGADFVRPDQQGSDFTIFTVTAFDGQDRISYDVTLRWVYSVEYQPELGMILMTDDSLAYEAALVPMI